MSSQDAIVAGLQAIVTNLSAQATGHMIQSKIFSAEGYSKLAEQYAEHTQEEWGYVEPCTKRLLDFGVIPKNEAKPESPVYADPVEWIKYDLQVSKDGLAALGQLVELARSDYATFDILKAYYADEEQDMYWGQQQLELIDKLGIQNWLTLQV